MLYSSASDWNQAAHKRVALFGMSGLGKTHVSNLLRDQGAWFHYSVDFRIGTRYMGEHIVDNFKREAMRVPFLRDLLRTDSIYIASNITFNNLSPLSSYLGKPGDPDKDGIPFEEYIRRQRLHRDAEVAAMLDTAHFVDKAIDIYGYGHFICDTSGSVCEVVDVNDPADEVMRSLGAVALPVWIRGSEADTDNLVQRFRKAPKPMYYPESFLREKWAEYLTLNAISEEAVDPDAFITWGYHELLQSRLPRYQAIAQNWGVTVEANEIAAIRDEPDFNNLIAAAIETKAAKT